MPLKTITGAQFRSEMRQPRAGAFLFYGDENFLKRRELESIRTKVCPDPNFAAFNHFVYNDENYDPTAILSALSVPPTMSELKLVEVSGIQFGDIRKKEDLDALENWLLSAQKSVDTVTIIYTTVENFDSGDAKSPSAMMKLVSKYVTPVTFEHETTQRLVLWVSKHFAAEKIIAEPPQCVYLIDVVGHDMCILDNEIRKLSYYLRNNAIEKLDNSHIDFICPHNRELGAFEFADAILDCNVEKSFVILSEMKRRNEPVQMIFGGMTKIYTDLYSLKMAVDAGLTPDDAAKRFGMHPFVAKLRMARAASCDIRALSAIIEKCSNVDEILKTSPSDDYITLEKLIIQIALYRKRKVFT